MVQAVDHRSRRGNQVGLGILSVMSGDELARAIAVRDKALWRARPAWGRSSPRAFSMN